MGRFSGNADDRIIAAESSGTSPWLASLQALGPAGWYVAAYEAVRNAAAERRLVWQGVRGIPRSASAAALDLLRVGAAPFCPTVMERQMVKCPSWSRYQLSRRSGRRPILREVPAFPGYIFAHAPTDRVIGRVCAESHRDSSHLDGLLCGASDSPIEVPQAVMTEFLGGPLDDPAPGWKKGDRLRVRLAPGRTEVGTFEAMRAEDRIILLLDMLGAQRVVEVSSELVEPE